MRTVGRWFTGLVAVAIVGGMCLSGEAADVKKFRLGWVVPRNPDHPYTVAGETFAKLMQQGSNGKIQMDLFPGGQLGGDRDMFEAIQMGNLDVGVISGPVVASFTKVLVGADMPYIFNNDYDLMYKVETGPAGQQILKKLEVATNLRALTFLFQPFRHLFTNKPVKSLADLKGMKLRTMESPVHRDIFSALGARPTPMPYPDIYTAMQTGTIDGHETDAIGCITSKQCEVSKYLSISGHFNNAFVLLMSKKAWTQLSPAEQKMAEGAAAETAKATLVETKRANAKYIKMAKDMGVVEFTPDLKPFVEAVKPVIEKYSAQVPEVREFVEAVRAARSQR